jgi:ligand-binding sensor domain-containing protein/DNA-binding CsgD family transcriptional regulator
MRYLLGIVFIIQISLYSQEVPPVRAYFPMDYNAENQNWSITQDPNKNIYIANNKGVLTFNGDDWKLYETPNESIMRSVFYLDGKLFSGFYNDFGYWEKDDFGNLNFTSLKDRFQIQMLEDEQIWEIYELDGWLLFKSLQRIYLINLKEEKTKVIEGKNNITKLSKVNDGFYFQDYSYGVYKIQNGEPVLLSDDNFLKNNKIVQFYDDNGDLNFVTQSKGIYKIVGSRIIPSDSKLNTILSGYSVYSAKQLNNGDFAIGTITNGLLYIDRSGEIRYKINQNKGLINNTILSIFEDADQNIWLGLDKGVGIVNMKSSFRFYNDKRGSFGTVYASQRYNGKIYLGTNQGLFYKSEGTNEDYQLMDNTLGQVWSLSVIDNELFCGHDKGTLLIDQRNRASIISDVLGTWMIRKIRKNTVIQGNYDGLHILTKQGNRWMYSHKIENYSTSSKQFELVGEKTIFVNHEYKGVYKLSLSDDLKSIVKNERIEDVKKGIHSSISQYNNKLLYASRDGVFVYDQNNDAFKRDSLYSLLLPKSSFESAKLVFDNEQNKLWSFTSHGLKYLSPGTLSSSYQVNTIPISGALIKGASGYENIMSLSDNRYLLGTSEGYVTLELDEKKTQENFNVNLSGIEKYQKDNNPEIVKLKNGNQFLPEFNNLVFYCNVSNFNKTYLKKYQYKLEGYNEVWNELSNTNRIVYKNLPSGKYTFKVVAFLNDSKSINEASYNFTIAKPWFESDLLYVVYLILFGILLYSIHLVTRRYYQKQREKILENTQKELEMKELENSKQIIKLNNEKLRNDIEGKNRELATSTMSIIKKNEFLNDIKNELMNGGEKSISKVIRIIDKDLNNTDDWKMFQEAFNNADKKFLRKIKTKHPDLTPNDLRLCAYLRLNLSSKEIAPLLNISPRSVEVKRYRLRKKMQLDHDINLTNYIIDI